MSNISSITLYVSFFVSLYFEVFLLINFLEKRTQLQEEELKVPNIFPTVTIIVPVFNEETTVTKTVFSLLKLDYPKDKLKIIVVNDGSTDGTKEILKRFRDNRRIEIIHKKNGGKYTALNAAIVRTTSELVGCLDADSFVLPDTLKKIVPYFENVKTMAVTPAIKIYEPDRFVRHVQINEYNLGIFIKKTFSFLGAITVTPGPFSIFRKKVFDDLGLFRAAHNTEDLEIAMRMQKNFYKIANAHNALVYTVGPGSLRTLYRQRVRWIHGYLANMIDYREMFFKREHGHLGFFLLPMGILSIVLFFASVGILLWNSMGALWNKIIEIETVGWHWSGLHLDWFFFNTNSKVFLSAILFVSTIILILSGRKISEKKTKGISIHTLYFPLVYAFCSVLWLSKAVYATALSKETLWR